MERRRIQQISAHLRPGTGAGDEQQSRQSTAAMLGLCAAPMSATHPNGLLANQVAIITGSGQGIGAETARLFAAEGASVVVTDLDAVKSDAVAAEINAAGGKAISVPGDVTDPNFPDRIVATTVQTFGKINHIVNNAGFTYDGMLHKMTDKQWQIMLDVHNTAPFRLIRAAAPHFRVKGGADMDAKTIVMVSSTTGLHGNLGQANYATGKSGVIGFAKTLAKEWGSFGVRVNTIAYGLIDTRLTRAKEAGEAIVVDGQRVAVGIPMGSATAKPGDANSARLRMIPLQRGGEPSDAAKATLFLCSPLSSYMTGHTLEVTGGAGI